MDEFLKQQRSIVSIVNYVNTTTDLFIENKTMNDLINNYSKLWENFATNQPRRNCIYRLCQFMTDDQMQIIINKIELCVVVDVCYYMINKPSKNLIDIIINRCPVEQFHQLKFTYSSFENYQIIKLLLRLDILCQVTQEGKVKHLKTINKHSQCKKYKQTYKLKTVNDTDLVDLRLFRTKDVLCKFCRFKRIIKSFWK